MGDRAVPAVTASETVEVTQRFLAAKLNCSDIGTVQGQCGAERWIETRRLTDTFQFHNDAKIPTRVGILLVTPVTSNHHPGDRKPMTEA